MNQTVIAKRARFEKRLFLAEIIILAVAFGILLADILMMIFYYKKVSVSTIVMSILFVIIILFCIIQIVLFIRCNKADENAILYDQHNQVFHLNLYTKQIEIRKEDITDIQVKDRIVSKGSRNCRYGSIVIKTKEKSYSIGFILNHRDAAKEIEKIIKR